MTKNYKKDIENLYKWKVINWIELKSLWHKEKLLILCKVSFYHNYFVIHLLRMSEIASAVRQGKRGEWSLLLFIELHTMFEFPPNKDIELLSHEGMLSFYNIFRFQSFCRRLYPFIFSKNCLYNDKAYYQHGVSTVGVMW